MARHYSFWRLASAALGSFAAFACHTHVALGQFTFNQAAAGSAIWHDNARWTPTGIPNAADATAQFNMPITSAPAGNGFTLNINDIDTTVGSINIDNTGNPNNFVTRICGASNCSGQIIFQSTSGPATYTENAGTDNTTNSGRFLINPNILLMSNLVVTQNNQPVLNTPTEFAGLITGDSDITITKNGVANLQLSNNLDLFPDEGFMGQIVINEGGIRMLGRSAIRNSSGVTVNSGAQMQLADNASTHNNPDWYMGDSAVLNLNGDGKVTGNSADGALRISIQATRTTTFHNPIVLQSDARIAVTTLNSFGVLDDEISGSGDLIKTGNGKLTLTNSGNSYTGDTQVLANILSLTNPYLANAADVYLTTGATLDLNFSGTDVIDSLFIDGASQAEGTWGATGNLSADFQTGLITGSGLLDVTTLVTPGLTGDYNDDGVVDAADYVVFRANESTTNALPNDPAGGTIGQTQYDNWTANFGMSSSGGGSSLSAVPEPSAIVLAFAGLLVAGGYRRRPA